MVRSPMTAPFVARDEQVATLLAAVRRAAAGEPGAVVLGGDAGVGKSRLLRHVTDLARGAGATTVVTHCVDLGEVGLPYLPFAEALSALRGSAPVDEVLGSRPELSRLLPSGGGAPPADEGTLRLQLFDGIAAVLGSVGRPGAPLVLVLEDVHWADSSTRDVVRYLIARMREEHLLLVVSYRTDDLHRLHPLRSTLAELWRHPRVERVDLAPFTDDELREFTAAVLGRALPEAVQRRIAERSEGNAYFAEELAERGPDADVPWTLADVLRARLEHLDLRVQRLARIASVAGRRVAEPLLRAVVAADGDPGLAGRGLDDALREAVAHHVLVGEDGRIAFRHALLAEVVYADLLPGEQSALHRRYLEAMASDPDLAASPTVAVHALRANDLPAALRASHAAALDAACLLAPQEELRHLETVLRLWTAVPDAEALAGEDEVRVLARAASAAGRAGEPQRAVALARDAVERSAADPLRQARLRGRLARHLLALDGDRAALDEAARALSDLPPDALDAHRAWALATHAHAAMWNDRDEEATASATAAVELARAAGVPAAEADALATLAVLVVDDPDRAATLLSTAVSRARDAGDVATEQRCTHNLATTLYYAGRLDASAAVIEEGLERTRASGLTWSDFGLSQGFFEHLVRYCRGDLADRPPVPVPDSYVQLYAAVRMYAAVARGDDVLGDRPAGPTVWPADGQVALIDGGCTIDALTWAGRHDEAVAMASDLIDHLGRAWDDYFLGAIWLAALGNAALADAAEIRRLGGGDVSADVAAGTRLLERAVASAERGRPRGGRLGPEGKGWLARVRAEHSRLTGENDPALWRAAVDAFSYGYRYEEARSRYRWAEALLAADDRAAAQEQATAAAQMAREIGAAPLAAAVTALARRGRLDLPGLHRSGQDLLTAREAEVLRLVAEGLSNRQIGERLFISGKTVSVHVSNLLAKLSVTGRAQAVSVAHRQGLLGVGSGDRVQDGRPAR